MKNRVNITLLFTGIMMSWNIAAVIICNLSGNPVTITINKWMGYPEEAPFSYELPPHTNLLIAQAEKCSVSGHPVAVASVFNNIRNDDMIFVLAESIIKISLE